MLPVPDMNASVIFSELSMGGFGFIPNLTVPDQSWIFPVTLGLLNLAIIEVSYPTLTSNDKIRFTVATIVQKSC